ncbi:MAG TPA: VOC family protein [Dehalococcoidia bacterium]|nr:VOC family protein [Dehalococcoidia bacterium]
MDLNHLLVPCTNKIDSANYFARLMGLPTQPVGHFAPVKINDSLMFDYAEADDVSLWDDENGHFARQHYAFKVDDGEFDAIFDRVKAEGLRYGSAPGPELYNMQVDSRRGGKRVYFDELNGHSIEIFTA